ncbi:MAG: endonuclease NucS [Nanoarchaeota archaeon]
MLDHSEFKIKFLDAIIKGHSMAVGCHCFVSYSGRAESELPWGDRIIIIKSDRTLLVHQNKGSTPVNYMKEAVLDAYVEGDYAVVTAENISQKEFMRIELTQVYFFESRQLIDEQKIRIVGTERDMAEMIMQNPSLISLDFKPLSMEEHTKFGFIDLFGHDKNGTLIVVECKRYSADLSAVTQLRRYVEKIKDMKGLSSVKGVLAAPKISTNAQSMLEKWGFSFVSVNPPKYLEKFDRFQKKLI